MSNKAQVDLDEFISLTNNFLSDNGFGISIEVNEDVVEKVNEIVSMAPEKIMYMEKGEANLYGLCVDQYCLYLDKCTADLENKIRFCTFYINKHLGQSWKEPEFEYIPQKAKEHAIAKIDNYLECLMKIRLTAESRLETISGKMRILQSLSYRLGRVK